jgi:uracil-DNA glycosylase
MHHNSVFLNSLESIDSSWDGFLDEDLINLLLSIEKNVIQPHLEHTPPNKKVLRFMERSLYDTKVIILGQDPYPQKGVATGRAFEVGTLRSWDKKFSNISLKNIIRAIYSAYHNQYLKYSEIKSLKHEDFPISAPNELFKRWEKQGVLLLNTSFTCEIGKSNSHEKYWSIFTNRLMQYIAKVNPNIIWFLWGNNAKAIVSDVPIKNKFESMHPMMCYQKPDRTDDFIFGKMNCFKQTKNTINWLG